MITIMKTSLYVECNSKEQTESVLKVFKQSAEWEGVFYVYSGADEVINFFADDPEVEEFDQCVIRLEAQLKEKFGLQLKGHWITLVDDELFTNSVQDGIVDYQSLLWIEDYGPEQARELQEYAEENFS